MPSQGEWVNYYEGRLPTGGSLVRMKHHVHMNILERAFFIDASAAELGLAARPLGPDGREIGAKEALALTRSPTHSLTYPLTHSLTHSLTRPPAHPPYSCRCQVPSFRTWASSPRETRGSTTGLSGSSPHRRSVPPASLTSRRNCSAACDRCPAVRRALSARCRAARPRWEAYRLLVGPAA